LKVDLHMHSSYSDGIFSPADLVERARLLNLAAISLTDHDCLDGTGEFSAAAAREGIEVVSGVELSAEYKGRDLHILGYGIDDQDAQLQDMLRRFRETRFRRGHKILEKLDQLGVKLDSSKVMAKCPEGSLGRPHIAEALLEQGYIRTIAEAFDRYIGEDGPAYVKKYRLSPTEAIDYIHGAGGLAFLAHPAFYLQEIEDLTVLVELGFDGIETAHPKHTSSQREALEKIAKQRGLLISGGSDFHGFEGKNTPMGEPEVPYRYYQDIMSRLGRCP
jgi:predicted metal-dependent phosphoesterase TrpH